VFDRIGAATPVQGEEFVRWYGPWDPVTPRQAAEILEPAGVGWWIVGVSAEHARPGHRWPARISRRTQ